MRSIVPSALAAVLGLSFFGRSASAEDVVIHGSGAGGFVSRSKLDDAPREITDTASLLQPMPGVHVRRLGADDSFATLSVRGTSSTQVAVYLAGVPLSGGADPTIDLATLPLWPGAQARVYRSFAPAALGRGSLGGTLVLDPPSPRAPPTTDVWAAVASFGSRRIRVGDVRGDPEGVRVASAINASRSDDDFSYLDPLATARDGHDVFTTRANAGHAQASGLASVAIPTSTGALTITTLAQARRQELPGTINARTLHSEYRSSRLLSALELTVANGPGALGVRAWARREGIAIRSAAEDAALTLGPRETDDAIIAAGTSGGWKGRPSEATNLEIRIDSSGERYAPGTWIGATQPPAARRANLGAAADASVRPLETTTVSASARGDLWTDASDGGGTETTSDARPTGNLGVEQGVGPLVLATHGGFLARPASFIERYGNRGAFIGDPGLRPERAKTVDAGMRTATKLGPVRLEAELAAFATWANDLIVFVPQGAYGQAKATNIGEARILGVESYGRAGFADFDLRASYTGLATRDETERGEPPLPGRPNHDVVFDVAWEKGPVRLRYGFDAVLGLRADLSGATVVPDRVLHSAGARVAVPGVRGLTVSLDVRNLFDLRVAEYAGALGPVHVPIGDLYEYPLPGRSFVAAARWVAK